jgi:hypothetical protein
LFGIQFCDERLRQGAASGGKDPYASLPFRLSSRRQGPT